jgi:Tfp pilus assembly protein PilO
MKNRNIVIFVAVLVLLTIAFALVVYSPQSNRLGAVRDQISRVAQQCEEDATKGEQIPQMQADVARLKSEFQDFDRRLPRQQELGEFLREISGAGIAGRLDDQMIKPGNPSTGTLYNLLPILMDFTCSFTELVGFLDRLNAMPRLTRVERITMSPTTDATQRVKVHMQVNIYFTKT